MKKLLLALVMAATLASCGGSTPPTITTADVQAGILKACNFQFLATTANQVIGQLINAYVPEGGTLTSALLTQIETDVCNGVRAKTVTALVSGPQEVEVVVRGVRVKGVVNP